MVISIYNFIFIINIDIFNLGIELNFTKISFSKKNSFFLYDFINFFLINNFYFYIDIILDNSTNLNNLMNVSILNKNNNFLLYNDIKTIHPVVFDFINFNPDILNNDFFVYIYLKIILLFFFIILGYNWSNMNESWNNWWIWDYSEIIIIFIFIFFILSLHNFYLFVDRLLDNDLGEDDYLFILIYFNFEFIIKYFSYSHNFIIEKQKNYIFLILLILLVDFCGEIFFCLTNVANKSIYGWSNNQLEIIFIFYLFTLNDFFFFNLFFIFNLIIFLYSVNLFVITRIFKKFNLMAMHLVFLGYVYFYYYRNSFYYVNTNYLYNIKKNINLINFGFYITGFDKNGILLFNNDSIGFNFYINFFKNLIMNVNNNLLFTFFNLNITYLYYFVICIFYSFICIFFFLSIVLVIKCTILKFLI